MTTRSFSFVRALPALFFIIVDYVQVGFVYPVIAYIFIHATPFDYPALFPKTTSSLQLHFFMALSYLLTPFFMAVGTPLLSIFSDLYGRRKILLIATVGTLLGVILLNNGVFIQSLALFFFGRALIGLGAAHQPLAAAVIADLSSEEKKARNMG